MKRRRAVRRASPQVGRRQPSTPRPSIGDRATAEDERSSGSLTATETADLCSGCVRCCTYISVQIDTPRSAWEYDQWIWAIDHRGISLYLERPEAWYLHVETTCNHLGSDHRCSIHGRHPVLCREYDPRSCERRLPLAGIVAWFHQGADLAQWLRRKRPAHYRRLIAYRGSTPPPVARERLPLLGIAPAGSFARPGDGTLLDPRPQANPVAAPLGRRIRT